MGVFDTFQNSNDGNSFASFPDITDYRLYVFVKGCDVKTRLEEFDEIYRDEMAFSIEIFNINYTAWKYIVLTPKPGAAVDSLIWEYLDIILWLSDESAGDFAYACPKQEGMPPIIALRDIDNQSGDTCSGVAGGRHFRADIPGREVVWGQSVPAQFDYEGSLREACGIDVKAIIGTN